MKKPFLYFGNPFLNAVKKNFRKAVKISIEHDAFLAARVADPDFAAMYTYYHPIHLAIMSAYETWLISGGTHKGATLALKMLMKQLSPLKINAWAVQVQNLYPKDTAEYMAIFPQGHKPFQTGPYYLRISACNALAGKLNDYPALAATMADVIAFASLMTIAMNAQKGDLENTGADSKAITLAVTAAMEAMYINFTNCLHQFPGNPAAYETVFPIDEIRRRLQTDYTGDIEKGESKTVFKRTFKPTQRIMMTNYGTNEIFLCATQVKNQAGSGGFGVGGGGLSVEVPVTDLGNIAVNKYITIYNPGDADANFEIRIL